MFCNSWLNFFYYHIGSFCGIVACDEYWGCTNRDAEAKLYILSGNIIYKHVRIIC